MLSTLSFIVLSSSLAFFPLVSFPASAFVTNNRSSSIYFITTRVSMPARLSLYAPLEPVIITYHLFLPANAGIGATLLCTHRSRANSLPLKVEGTIPSSTTEPPDNKYSTTNLLITTKLSSISLSRAHALSHSTLLFLVNHLEPARSFKKIHDRVRPDDVRLSLIAIETLSTYVSERNRQILGIFYFRSIFQLFYRVVLSCLM